MEIKIDSTCKGTRILAGDTAKKKRDAINKMIEIVESYGYTEIMIPILNKEETFASKVGEENNNLMYKFKDLGDRNLCLAPEYTSIIIQLTEEKFKYQKDVKLFYIGECFRAEKNQKGRYRQFTQFGVEVLNPSVNYLPELIEISIKLVELFTNCYELNLDVTRGLNIYQDNKGFEISCSNLGSSKQVCGGGIYKNGAGFAIGLDRILLAQY